MSELPDWRTTIEALEAHRTHLKGMLKYYKRNLNEAHRQLKRQHKEIKQLREELVSKEEDIHETTPAREEKQAEILKYKKQELRIAKIQLTLTSQLVNLKAEREMIARCIQELQNLKLEL